MARSSHREQILVEGLKVVHARGFNAAGVRDIVAAAGVPQGSFTNHFRSKEQFGVELLDRYTEQHSPFIEATLMDQTRPPLDRIKAYLQVLIGELEQRNWCHGCLVGNMSLEASEHSELIRERLVMLFQTWRKPMADCLEQAQAEGDLRTDLDPDTLADFLLAAWQGAMMRMKVGRDPAPLRGYLDIVTRTLLTP